MSYRSDVGLALTKDGVETLRCRLAAPEIGAETRECIEEFLEHADKHARDKENGHEAWYWDYLKWYTEDPETCQEGDFIEKPMTGSWRTRTSASSASARIATPPRCAAASGKIPLTNMELTRGISFSAAV